MRRLLLTGLLFLTACAAGDGSASAQQAQTPPILVDQFGYLPSLDKVAIIKDPKVGFDSRKSFSPSRRYAVINLATGQAVHTGQPKPWKNGQVDDLSGDRVWYFDFSNVQKPGRYVVRDVERRVDSYAFEISSDVYKPVLKSAFKTLYLQRAGFEKTSKYAGPWADKASHLRRGQDTQARLFSRPQDASTQRDLRGGWYDAGDYNKYTNWTAKYVIGLLGAYAENPNVWTDDFDIPESGNGIPDILDEVKWGLDWLERMQNQDGSMLSVMGVGAGSPPSSAKDPSRYGPPNTSAAVFSAGAFAMAAKVYGRVPAMEGSAKRYASRAEKAWRWAEANPNVKFWNNDARSNSEGLAAGQQEVDADRLAKQKLIGAVHMSVLTGDPYFHQVISRLYDRLRPMKHNTSDGHEGILVADLLYYSRQAKTPPRMAARIKRDFERDVLNAHNAWPAKQNAEHAYRSFVDGYWWGSNYTKSQRASVFTQAVVTGAGNRPRVDYLNAAADYLHYIHGANPLNKVYLSNMGRYGAENSVKEFYHEWFKDGSVWDAVGSSRFGPAPGFLVGGPNDGYARDSCCATGCPGAGARLCRIPVKTPPSGQPASKSYADFNEGWPINSWEVTENSNSYQISYIRLLSKFTR